ncbi:MAG: radical SAM protein [Thermodesulfobacteriota bacterium]|nr:radical SAM protein [Thermodesulfobacteriota bacterium]
MKYDAIIIDSLISYQNVAFDFGLVNLRIDEEIMALPNLMKHFHPAKSESFVNQTLCLEECGKLNGICLYDYLKKSGFNCALVSNVLENEEQLTSLLSEGAHAVLVSTTWTIGIREVKKVTQLVRNYDAEVPVIVGGVLIYNSYRAYQQMDDEDFDHQATDEMFFFINQEPELFEDINMFIVDRSGTNTLSKVLRAIKDKEDYRSFENTAYYLDHELIFNPQNPEKIDLDNQVIAWNNIEQKYIPEILPVQLSLGCNFNCKFCNFYHKQRCYTKSKEAIRRELKGIKSLPNVRMIRFVDDSMPGKVLQNLCEIMIEEKMDIPWTTFIRLDTFIGTDLDLLQKANCVDVQVGIESGDDRILKNMNKKVTRDQYLRILDDLSELDISIRASFILGFPGENSDSINNTIDFLNQLPTEKNATFYVGIAPFVLIPLSPIYSKSERKAYQLKGNFIDWQHDNMSSADVPDYLKKIFLGVKDEVLFTYTADPLDIYLPREPSIQVKRTRQKYQKGIVKGLAEVELEALESDLMASLEKMQVLV